MRKMSKNVTLTTAQQEAIDELNQNLQIIACAGSGKTEVITRRIANILQKNRMLNLKILWHSLLQTRLRILCVRVLQTH